MYRQPPISTRIDTLLPYRPLFRLCGGARCVKDRWEAPLEPADGGRARTVSARALVNAAGPWVTDMLDRIVGVERRSRLRLVKGSHIVVRRAYEGEHAYIFQNDDRRIVFAIPYEDRFTLIGTTDLPYDGNAATVAIEDRTSTRLNSSH